MLVVVVDDHDRADEAEQGAGRVLEALDEPALGSLAPILEVEGELVQRLRGGRLVARFGDCRLPGRPLVGRLGVRVGLGCAGLFRPLGIARHGGLVEPDVLRLRLGEGLQDVGRVVDLYELGSRVDDLGLGDPVAARLAEAGPHRSGESAVPSVMDDAHVRRRAGELIGQRRSPVSASVVDDQDLAVVRQADRRKLRDPLGDHGPETGDLVIRRDRHSDPHPGESRKPHRAGGVRSAGTSVGDGQLRP